MNYLEVIQNIESRTIMPKTAPGLEKMKKALEVLKFKDRPDQTIVVAGTNGKGSTAAALESLLRNAGESVGLYTSPHLIQTTERIRINGEDLSEEEFTDIFNAIDPKLKALELTHFEILTAMAVSAFEANRVQWRIYEVGLGGIWDATNAIPHSYAVISPISFDHMGILGHSIDEITKNKLGIATHEYTRKMIYAPFPIGSEDVLSALREKKPDLKWIPRLPFDYSSSGVSDTIFIKNNRFANALPGLRGAENSALACTCFEALGFQIEEHAHSLSQIRWPGRMEKIQFLDRDIYLSGDHNASGAESVQPLIDRLPNSNSAVVLLGIGESKDLDGILMPFTKRGRDFVLTETPFQTLSLESYRNWLSQCKWSEKDPVTALERLIHETTPSTPIIVSGSLYLVGLIRKTIRERSIDHPSALDVDGN